MSRAKMRKLQFTELVIIVFLCVFASPLLAQESEWVTVEGFAPIENVTKTEARKLAIDNARREAVEQVVGVDLLSETMVINYNVTGDVIRAIPHGKVIGIEILNEDIDLIPAENKGDVPFLAYKVKIRANVAKEIGTTDSFFRLDARANRKVFKEGDLMEIQVTPSKDCYLTIFNVLEDEKVLVLFPNRFNQNNYIKANTQFTFPGNDDRKKGITLEAFLDKGQEKADEMFHVLALKEPLYFNTATFKEGIFGVYDGQTALVNDLVKNIVGIPLSHRAEKFIQYRITK
jgi:hypothetical protein